MSPEHSLTTMPDSRTAIEARIPDATEGSVVAIADAIRHDGLAYLPASAMRRLLGGVVADQWGPFAASWNTLDIDRYMKDGGTYRRRRHAVFSFGEAGLARQPDRPHFQEVSFNHLNGGIPRNFAPVAPDIADLPLTRAIVSSFAIAFETLAPQPSQSFWDIEMHQFRIEAEPDQHGLPTPEGVHRDGVDWVVMMMVDRTNVSGGVTLIEDLGGTSLFEFLLEASLDTVVLDDRRFRHGASPVSAQRHGRPAHRDMLVLTYCRRAVYDAA